NYHHLSSSSSFKDPWEQQNDYWFTTCREPLTRLHVQMSFPKDLPNGKWRQGDFGLIPTPSGWADAICTSRDNKRLLTISSKDTLKPGIQYKVRIDGRITPH